MATNVPTVTFGPNGFDAPSGPDVLAGVQADINAAFGSALSYSLNSPQGQLASSEAALIVNTNSIFVYYTNQVDPAYATGRMQDAIARIYFIERLPAQPTVLQVSCVGLQGVVIPVGALVVDSSGNVYQATGEGTIPVIGSLSLSFAAVEVGPTPVPPTVTIYQAIPGWDSAIVTSGTVGQDTETRKQFEDRREQSVAKNSVGALSSILGAVLSVDGVLDAYVTENTANTTVVVRGFTLAAHSLYVAVTGGSAEDVARAIWSKKAPGCDYNGNTTVTVEDDNVGYSTPFPSYDVTFEIPPSLPIIFSVVIQNSGLVPSDAVTQIQNAIIAAFGGSDGGAKARIGSNIYASRYMVPVASLGTWAAIVSLQVGSANTSAAIVRGYISGTTMTVTSVVSGALVIGQTIVGLGIIAGTMITAGASLSWTVSESQSVAGAAFTGTGSGTNLTVTAVTGTINVGDYLSGTGIPVGTTIVSQTSGTTGGAGVYVTSGATTASSAAIRTNVIITGILANQNLVEVGIAQQPTIDAANINVTLS